MRINELPERYWGLVDLPSDLCAVSCWEWIGTRTEKGYGRFWQDGSFQRAHRLILGLEKGDPQWALHRCDTPSCVNPDHLYIGTASDNQRDRAQRTTEAKRKMTPAQTVLEIRKANADGVSCRQLAVRYEMNETTVGSICRGTTHKKGPWPT